jgi:hydrogenase expression/formation protein HypD
MSSPSLPFRDPVAAAAVLRQLARLPEPDRPLTFMHVCGTHENALARSGLRRLLPPWLRLIAGPGCPVCVCPPAEIAAAARLTLAAGAVVATFGDMLRVPGGLSLEEARACGGDIRVVLGAAEAAELATAEPERLVVFLAVGFETTACTTAAALLADPAPNFLVLSVHRLIPPALAALLHMDDVRVDGFLLPGHVLTVTGAEAYEEALRDGGRPAAVAGFEPLDMLLGIHALARRALSRESGVDNLYPRAVRPAGNPRALAAMDRVFRVGDAAWRGLGIIPASGLLLREEFSRHDAREHFAALLDGVETEAGAEDPPGCRCGDVMVGRLDPRDCPLFGTECTPDTPRGACMVGGEGTCRARFLFPEVWDGR